MAIINLTSPQVDESLTRGHCRRLCNAVRDSQAKMTWQMKEDGTLLVTYNHVVWMFLVVLSPHSLEI